MDNKQEYYRLSKEIKRNGWIQGGGAYEAPTEPEETPAPPKEEIVLKHNKPVMPESMVKAPEANYLPPVAVLPSDGDCDCYLVMSTLKRSRFGDTYEPAKGLDRGTIFPDLDLPFLGEGGKGND